MGKRPTERYALRAVHSMYLFLTISLFICVADYPTDSEDSEEDEDASGQRGGGDDYGEEDDEDEEDDYSDDDHYYEQEYAVLPQGVATRASRVQTNNN